MNDDDIGIEKHAPSLLSDILTRVSNAASDPKLTTDPKLLQLLEPFQESCQLLDPILEALVKQLSDRILLEAPVVQWPFELLYSLCKIRGAKTVSRFLPCQVNLLEDIVVMLENAGDSDHPHTWQQRFGLLLWLSILVLAPFDLETFGNETEERIYTVAKTYLSVPGKERDSACLVMARLLSRPDCTDTLLPVFAEYASGSSSGSGSTLEIFRRIGILQTTATLARLALPSNVTVLRFFSKLLDQVLDDQNPNSVYQKLRIKNLGRIALIFLTSEDDDVLSTVDAIIANLLASLGHKDTMVRYSASKAVARVIGKIPEEDLRDELTEAVIAAFDENRIPDSGSGRDLRLDRVSHFTWHGTLLCIAEMMRRHLIASEQLLRRIALDMLPVAMRFEQQRITYSVGSNVRDAACYVCWSMFRAYQKDDGIFQSIDVLDSLLKDLVYLACYDPEVNIRRAASAALQEGIGRQGGFDGSVHIRLAIVQTVDYFKVGLRSRAFLEVAISVYSLGITGVVDYALTRTVFSADPAVRVLCAKSLGLLVRADPSGEVLGRCVQFLLSNYETADTNARHGTTYSLGQVLLASQGVGVNNERQTELVRIVDEFTEADLRGTSNEVLNCEAFLRLFHFIASRLETNLVTAERLQKVALCLELDNAEVIESAADLIREYSLRAEIPDGTCHQWIDRMMDGRHGFAVALGSFKKGCIPEIVDGLVKVIMGDKQAARVIDINTRKAAVSSLASVLADHDGEGKIAVFPAFDSAFTDYTIDARGDVGSWVRSAAIEKSSIVVKLCHDREQKTRVVEHLLRISVEPLDKLRRLATEALRTIATEVPLDESISGVVAATADVNSAEYFYEMAAILHAGDTVGDAYRGIVDTPAVIGLSRLNMQHILEGFITTAGNDRLPDKLYVQASDGVARRLRSCTSGLVDGVISVVTKLMNPRAHGMRMAINASTFFNHMAERGISIRDRRVLAQACARITKCLQIVKRGPLRAMHVKSVYYLCESGCEAAALKLAQLSCHSADVGIRELARDLLYDFSSPLADDNADMELIASCIINGDLDSQEQAAESYPAVAAAIAGYFR